MLFMVLQQLKHPQLNVFMFPLFKLLPFSVGCSTRVTDNTIKIKGSLFVDDPNHQNWLMLKLVPFCYITTLPSCLFFLI